MFGFKLKDWFNGLIEKSEGQGTHTWNVLKLNRPFQETKNKKMQFTNV